MVSLKAGLVQDGSFSPSNANSIGFSVRGIVEGLADPGGVSPAGGAPWQKTLNSAG